MNSKSAAISIIVLIIIVVVAFLAFGHSKSSAPTMTQTASSSEMTQTAGNATTTSAGATAPATSGTKQTTTTTTTTTHKSVTITYGPNGFSPKTVSIPVGSTVTWVNQSSGRMWVASAVHPTHTVYDGTSTAQHCANGAPTSSAVFDECAAGSSFTFTFTKAGTWPFHNHANASDFGSVTVTP